MIDKNQTPLIGYTGQEFVSFVPKMMNRHGLITGATGTGKTVTLQTLAETFSQMGVSVFAADMKGDLSGIAKPGGNKSSVEKRVEEYGLSSQGFAYKGCPVEFWDAFGEQGHPLRITVSSLGPLLLERLLDLNETQGGVLSIIFKIAEDKSYPLIDLKDLQAMVKFVGENRNEFTNTYGNIASASIGAIQRSLLRLENEGGHHFFGEPSLDVYDLFRSAMGQGMVNILAADKLSRSPRIYTTLLLWLLSFLYDNLPEVGDLERPKLVLFLDEAHMIFNGMSRVLLEKVEQIIRLIRSKGVGVYFCTQFPSDIPSSVLGQLGNKVQHALRAYTPEDQRALKAAADGLRPNPDFNTAQVIAELSTGEAIISMLDAKGAPSISMRASILPPQSFIGPLTPSERQENIAASMLYGKYTNALDRESAYERIGTLLEEQEAEREKEQAEKERLKQEKEQEKARLAQEKEEARLRREQEREQRAARKDAPGGLLEDLSRQIGRTTKRQVTNEISRRIGRTIINQIIAFFGKKR